MDGRSTALSSIWDDRTTPSRTKSSEEARLSTTVGFSVRKQTKARGFIWNTEKTAVSSTVVWLPFAFFNTSWSISKATTNGLLMQAMAKLLKAASFAVLLVGKTRVASFSHASSSMTVVAVPFKRIILLHRIFAHGRHFPARQVTAEHPPQELVVCAHA